MRPEGDWWTLRHWQLSTCHRQAGSARTCHWHASSARSCHRHAGSAWSCLLLLFQHPPIILQRLLLQWGRRPFRSWLHRHRCRLHRCPAGSCWGTHRRGCPTPLLALWLLLRRMWRWRWWPHRWLDGICWLLLLLLQLLPRQLLLLQPLPHMLRQLRWRRLKPP
jgi:hypothetical protein